MVEIGMNLDRAQQLLKAFAGKRLLVVGDVVLDRYVDGKVERLNPEAPVPILHAQGERQATGGAGNVAKNARHLGGETILVSVVGDDAAGREIASAAAAEGYTAALIQDASRPSIEKRRYYVGSQQMLRVDYEETHDITGKVEEEVLAAIAKWGKNVDGILVSDYAKGVITPRVAELIMELMRVRGLPVMVDLKPSRVKYFQGVTFMSPNRKEAHEFLGLPLHARGGVSKEELAVRLRDAFESTIFLTLSEEGIYVLGREGIGAHFPQSFVGRDEVADPSGCGDTVATTVLLAKMAGAQDAEAAELANAAAGVVVRKVGSVAASPEEIVQTLHRSVSMEKTPEVANHG